MTDQFERFGARLQQAATRRQTRRRRRQVGSAVAGLAIFGTSGAFAAGLPILDPLGLSWVRSEQSTRERAVPSVPITLHSGSDWSASVHRTPEGAWQFDLVNAAGDALGTGLPLRETAAAFSDANAPRVQLISVMPVDAQRVALVGVADPSLDEFRVSSDGENELIRLRGTTFVASVEPGAAPRADQDGDPARLTLRPFAIAVSNPGGRDVDISAFEVVRTNDGGAAIVVRGR